MKPLLSLVLVSLALMTGCGHAGGSSSAGACAAPISTASDTEVTPGQVTVLRASRMFDGCNDQGRFEELRPFRDVAVAWTQGESVILLTRADADQNGRISLKVTVPSGAQPGKGQLSFKDGGAPVTEAGDLAQAAQLTVRPRADGST